MQKSHILIFFLLAASVSSEQVRLLWKEDQSLHVDIYCKNWDKKTGTCVECYDGCTKWENICVKIVQHCAKWDEQGNCSECQTGYGDSQQKSINGSCPKQQTPKTQNIKTQATNTQAPKTQTHTSPSGGQTQTQTKQSSPPKKGQSLSSVKNQPQLPLVDIHCQCHTEDRECIDCFNGYYLDFNATCQQVPENCTAANELGECTACVIRFVVENGTCVQQQCDYALCTAFSQDQTECTACSYRSYLDNGCCVQVNGFCSKWIEATGECTACYSGYVIDPNNKNQCILS